MLEILISSSVLILVLALLRLALRDRISARLQYALWLLVLVRLLVPVSFFHSPVSVAEAAAPAVTRVQALSDAVVTYERIYRGIGTAVEPDAEGTFEHTQTLPRWTVRDIARYVRYAGMGVMAAWFLLVNIRLARRLKKDRTPYDTAAKLSVYIAPGLPSPCLFGLFRPAIYLTPRAAEDDARARQIIAHERTHYRHGDMIWSLLRSVCLVVWWFHPLVWLAAALSRQDCELACDEGTIEALGEDARFDYGRTLVGMAAIGTRPSDLLCGATTMTAGRQSLKERVARIANAPKMSVTVAVIVLLIAAVAVGCTFSGAEENGVAVEPEAAMEPAPAGTASASDAAAARPGVLAVAFFDAESATNSSDIVTEQIELGEFYDFFRFMDAKSTQDAEGPGFSRPVSRTTLFFFDDLAAYERDERTTGFAVWEDGWFEFFHGENGDTVFYDEDGSYLRLFEDIIEKWYSESAEAVFVSGEPLGASDQASREADAAQTRAVLAQVGDYGLPGWTQIDVKASIGTAPYDTERGTELYHALVYKSYVAQDGVTDLDLHYERFWSDDPGAGNITADTFADLREFYPTAYEVFRDGFTVGGQPAFVMSMDGQQSLWWYDAERDMIFYLWSTSGASGEIDEPLLGYMLALAETVTAP